MKTYLLKDFSTIENWVSSDDTTISLSDNWKHTTGRNSVKVSKTWTTEAFAKLWGANLLKVQWAWEMTSWKICIDLIIEDLTWIENIKLRLGNWVDYNEYVYEWLIVGKNQLWLYADRPTSVAGKGLNWGDVARADIEITLTDASINIDNVYIDRVYIKDEERDIITLYENKSFIVADGITDYNCKELASCFDKIPTAWLISIRTDKTISFKINGIDNDDMTIGEQEWLVELDRFKISNLFITNNSWEVANVEIFIA